MMFGVCWCWVWLVGLILVIWLFSLIKGYDLVFAVLICFVVLVAVCVAAIWRFVELAGFIVVDWLLWYFWIWMFDDFGGLIVGCVIVGEFWYFVGLVVFWLVVSLMLDEFAIYCCFVVLCLDWLFGWFGNLWHFLVLRVLNFWFWFTISWGLWWKSFVVGSLSEWFRFGCFLFALLCVWLNGLALRGFVLLCGLCLFGFAARVNLC